MKQEQELCSTQLNHLSSCMIRSALTDSKKWRTSGIQPAFICLKEILNMELDELGLI